VPGFGDASASLVIVGLAPAAHGANRTGRMFTGDRSGDFLFAAVQRAGLASQAESRNRDDGLALRGIYVTAACRCAPPENRPTPIELETCQSWLRAELALLQRARVYLALGSTGYQAVVSLSRVASGLAKREYAATVCPPRFSHGVVAQLPDPRGSPGGCTKAWLYASYHVSQQNTQTGRLTESMFDRVLLDASRAAGILRPRAETT